MGRLLSLSNIATKNTLFNSTSADNTTVAIEASTQIMDLSKHMQSSYALLFSFGINISYFLIKIKEISFEPFIT